MTRLPGLVLLLALALVTIAPGPAPASERVARSVDTIDDITVTGAATLIDAADSARVALNCTNNSSTVNVRWGDSAVTASSGQRLKADLSIEIKGTYAVYMISEGASVTVSCTKEKL